MNLKRLFLLVSVFMTMSLYAADSLKTVSFAYDVDFKMNFDNRELYKSAYSRSMTIFGARVTPSVGLAVRPQAGEEHKVMIGADIMKDFGGVQTRILEELTLYYRMQKDLGDTDLTLYAGIFPRSRATGDYSPAFFSDSLLFYDNNLEGVMLQIKRPKASFEVACDWMGQYGPDRREKFMIFSAGEGEILPFMSLGYAGYLQHFANSYTQKGVVDNILLNPYIRFDFGHLTDFQTLSVNLGYLQAFQNNRKHVGHYIFPGGLHVDLEVRKWNIALKNKAFYGTDLMPYYNNHDEEGTKYGSNLYLGDPFYRIHDDHSTGAGLYDRFEVCYEPSIGRYLKVRIAALFHFHGFHYSGCQQIVGLRASF